MGRETRRRLCVGVAKGAQSEMALGTVLLPDDNQKGCNYEIVTVS